MPRLLGSILVWLGPRFPMGHLVDGEDLRDQVGEARLFDKTFSYVGIAVRKGDSRYTGFLQQLEGRPDVRVGGKLRECLQQFGDCSSGGALTKCGKYLVQC